MHGFFHGSVIALVCLFGFDAGFEVDKESLESTTK